VQDILHFQHYQHRSDTGSLRSFLIRFRQGPQSQCPVLIWAIVLASLFDARSRKDFFGGGGSVFIKYVEVKKKSILMEGGKAKILHSSKLHFLHLNKRYSGCPFFGADELFSAAVRIEVFR
jgi:hypothetical protein